MLSCVVCFPVLLRLKAGRPIPVPGSGMQVTQLGHVKDLATAFRMMLVNPVASRQVYNIAGERCVVHRRGGGCTGVVLRGEFV